MAKKMKVGIIGCGHIARTYFPGIKKFTTLELVGCADLNPAAARARGAEFNVPVMSVDELIMHPEIELVVNITVPQAHAEVAGRCLNNGKHAYSEKPLATTLADADNLLALAKAKNLRIGCAPDTILGGGQQTCRKIIDDGLIGQPICGTAVYMGCGPERFFHPNPKFFYESGGGPLFDMGPYYITALVNLLGPVKQVSAVSGKGYRERIAGPQAANKGERIQVKIPTHYSGTLEFHNGAIITLVVSWDVWKHQHHPIEIYGTEGALLVPDPNTFGGPVRMVSSGQRFAEWSDVPIAHDYTDNSRGVGAVDMAAAARTGRKHRCCGELARHVLEVMVAFHEAGLTSGCIEIKSSSERPAAMPIRMAEGDSD